MRFVYLRAGVVSCIGRWQRHLFCCEVGEARSAGCLLYDWEVKDTDVVFFSSFFFLFVGLSQIGTRSEVARHGRKRESVYWIDRSSIGYERFERVREIWQTW